MNLQADEGGDLSFIQNKGQWHNDVRYKAEVSGGAVFFTEKGFRYNFYDQQRVNHLHHNHADKNDSIYIDCHAYDVQFVGANPQDVSARDKRSFHHNYFLGNDSTMWASNVPLFSIVDYKSLYSHIDLNVYSRGNTLKYDLIVLPGGNTDDIKLRFDGVTPQLNESGDIVIKTAFSTIIEKAPFVYQFVEDKKVKVPCNYNLQDGTVSFDFPNGYDKSRILYIDPALIFATYTGSSGNVWGYCSAYDAYGDFFAASQAKSSGYPITTGAYSMTYNNDDIAICKYNPSGTTLLYATYCGGSNSDVPTAMRFNRNNELVITGYTTSVNYPITSGAFDGSHNLENDIFVTVFSANGSALVGSTYIGGSGHEGISLQSINTIGDGDKNMTGLSVDSHMDIYVATSTDSKDFPVTTNAFQGTHNGARDGCVFKLSRNCQNLLYSTYLGGNSSDCIYDCKLKDNKTIVVSGLTNSDNFPITSNAHNDSGRAFVCILDTAGNQLLSSTKMGLKSISAVKLSLDDDENVFVCGVSDSGYAISNGVHHQTNGKVYMAKMTPALDTLLKSTRVIDTDVPVIMGFSNVCGEIVAAFFTRTIRQQPLTSNAFLSNPTVYYMMHLNPGFDTLRYGSYFGTLADSTGLGSHMHGSSVIDSNGVIYYSACNSLTKNRLIGTTGSHSPTSQSGANDNDHYSAKFDMEVKAAKPISIPVVPDTGCVNIDVIFDNLSKYATNYIWYFGDGDTSHAVKPAHKFDSNKVYTVRLEAYNPFSCQVVHSATKTIYIDSVKMTAYATIPDTACLYDQVYMVNQTKKGVNYLWDYGDGNFDTTFHGQHAFGKAGLDTIKLISFNPAVCNPTDTFYHEIYIDGENPQAGFTVDKSTLCTGSPIQFTNTTNNGVSYEWHFGDNTTSVQKDPTHTYTNKWGLIDVKLVATNNMLCVEKDTATVGVNILEPLQVELPDTFICGYQDVELEVKLIHANTDIKYSWSPANALLSPGNTQLVKVDPRISKYYIVTVTDSIPGMCRHVVKDTGQILVVDYPEGVQLTTNSPICVGDTLLLDASVSPYVPRLNYVWGGPKNYTAYDSNAMRTETQVVHSGVYELFVDNQGCMVSKKVEVVVSPKPDVRITSNSPLLSGDSLLLKMTTSIPWDSLFWEGPLGFKSSLEEPKIYKVTSDNEGSYTLKVVAGGCVGGAVTTVQVDTRDSLYVKLYPNPNGGKFFIEGRSFFEQAVPMYIVNVLGQKMLDREILTEDKYFKEEIVLSSAASGEYVMWLLLDGEYWAIPFIIARD